MSLDDVQSAVGGYLISVKDGQIDPGVFGGAYDTQLYTRAAVRIKADGSVVTFATHGRNAPIACGHSFETVAKM